MPKTSHLEGFHPLQIFGFDLKLNLTLLLLALLIIWTLAAGLFPTNYPRLTPQTYWWMGLASALGILFSIIFHELSHALRAALWQWHKDLHRATRIASAIGAGFGLAIMMVGLISILQGNFIGGMWWFLIGVFLRTAAKNSYRQQLIHEMLSDKPVRHFMNNKLITVPSTTTLEQLLEGYIYQHHFKMFPVIQDSTLIGCISIKDLKKIPRYQWAQRTVGELCTPCSATNTVSADTSVSQVISSMAKSEVNSCYMVVDNKQLVGIVSLKDLSEFISLKLELEPAKD
jgi:CBS domain-containing protein